MRSRTHAWALRESRPAQFVSVYGEEPTPDLAQAVLFQSKRAALEYRKDWAIRETFVPVGVRLS